MQLEDLMDRYTSSRAAAVAPSNSTAAKPSDTQQNTQGNRPMGNFINVYKNTFEIGERILSLTVTLSSVWKMYIYHGYDFVPNDTFWL
jgi:hypothetical protein